MYTNTNNLNKNELKGSGLNVMTFRLTGIALFHLCKDSSSIRLFKVFKIKIKQTTTTTKGVSQLNTKTGKKNRKTERS